MMPCRRAQPSSTASGTTPTVSIQVIASASVANVPLWRLYILLRLYIHRVGIWVGIGRVVPRRKWCSDKDPAHKEGGAEAAPMVEMAVVKASSMKVTACVDRSSKRQRQRTHEHETDDLFHG